MPLHKILGVGYLQVDTVRGKRISPDAALHGVPPLKTFVQIEHVSEPKEIDKPVQCPPSENSIIQVFPPGVAPYAHCSASAFDFLRNGFLLSVRDMKSLETHSRMCTTQSYTIVPEALLVY